MIETETADFAHLDGDPFASSRAFVYATGAPAHKGISDEGNQPLKTPNSYKDAMKSPQWKDSQGAIQKEMDSLKQHDVNKLVNISSIPKGEKTIGTRFVFKQKADGRFKARLVVQGHAQEPGVDYGRSYAPVCRIGSTRTLLAIACEHGWPVWQMDVVVAFLQSLIDKDVFVEPAPRHDPRNSKTGEVSTSQRSHLCSGTTLSTEYWWSSSLGPHNRTGVTLVPGALCRRHSDHREGPDASGAGEGNQGKIRDNEHGRSKPHFRNGGYARLR